MTIPPSPPPSRPSSPPSGYKRGEIRWADVKQAETKGSEQHSEDDTPRCWVIISADAVNRRYPVVVGIPLSIRAKPNYPTRVIIEPDDIDADPGVEAKRLVAMTEQVRVLAVERFLQRYGVLLPPALARVEAALRYAIALP